VCDEPPTSKQRPCGRSLRHRESQARVSKSEHSTNKTQPDLNLTILSHLAIRDLTRATRVSKQWQSSILSFAEPRRTLFLEPAPASGEYLDWLKDRDQRCYKERRMWHPAIVREPSWRGKAIVKPHPIIADGVCPIHKIRIHIDLPATTGSKPYRGRRFSSSRRKSISPSGTRSTAQ
jgi:hypothetical protein